MGLEIILDSSEYYDYDLGGTDSDYIISHGIIAEAFRLTTEDGIVLMTEDNYTLIYD